MSDRVTVWIDGEEISLPSRWVVCPTCQGRGSSSEYLGAFTADEFSDMGDDFQEAYIRGDLDRPCSECRGRTTVLEADYEYLTNEQREAYERELESEARARAMEIAERRMGA